LKDELTVIRTSEGCGLDGTNPEMLDRAGILESKSIKKIWTPATEEQFLAIEAAEKF
jgi:hypothetical protein